jgi:hypothetical protein
MAGSKVLRVFNAGLYVAEYGAIDFYKPEMGGQKEEE